MNSFSGQPLLKCLPCFGPGLFRATPRLRCGRDESWMELNCLILWVQSKFPLETLWKQSRCPRSSSSPAQMPLASASSSRRISFWQPQVEGGALEERGPCYPRKEPVLGHCGRQMPKLWTQTAAPVRNGGSLAQPAPLSNFGSSPKAERHSLPGNAMLVPGVEGAGRAVPLEPRGRGSSLPSKGQRKGEMVAPKGPETILQSFLLMLLPLWA